MVGFFVPYQQLLVTFDCASGLLIIGLVPHVTHSDECCCSDKAGKIEPKENT